MFLTNQLTDLDEEMNTCIYDVAVHEQVFFNSTQIDPEEDDDRHTDLNECA